MAVKRRATYLFLIFSIFVTQQELCAAPHVKLRAQSAVVMNAGNGKIFYAKNPDRPMQPASLTKILSLYLVHEAIKEGRISPSDRVKISVDAQLTGGSSMFLVTETEVELEELIKGMAVVSANDAAVAVAEHVGGSVERFVEMMNAKARKLGMRHSRFKNPNGLPAEGQVSTARDIIRLARAYIRDFPEALHFHSMQHYTFREVTQENLNSLLKERSDVDGLKTGFVRSAGYHLIVTATRDDTRLIVVVMGEKNPKIRAQDASRLLEAGFRMTGRRAK
jgi:D-alanyl-D-alanine carboxypeptidase (penicillin-binding protein 5/6)